MNIQIKNRSIIYKNLILLEKQKNNSLFEVGINHLKIIFFI